MAAAFRGLAQCTLSTKPRCLLRRPGSYLNYTLLCFVPAGREPRQKQQPRPPVEKSGNQTFPHQGVLPQWYCLLEGVHVRMSTVRFQLTLLLHVLWRTCVLIACGLPKLRNCVAAPNTTAVISK